MFRKSRQNWGRPKINQAENMKREIVAERISKFEQATKNRKIMNVLFLGEAGVGKLTWINAVFNYLNFAPLYETVNQASITYAT